MTRIALIIASSLLLAACQSQPENNNVAETAAPETSREAVAERRVVRERADTDRGQDSTPTRTLPGADPSRTIPLMSGELEDPGYGLDMIIDGSSPQAFTQSLEIIASDTSNEQYQELHAAMQYLRTYSFGVRDLPSLYEHLDGRTGQEVIEMAREMRRQRSGR
jgi:hypothetical protein